jgi:hypothetical protein
LAIYGGFTGLRWSSKMMSAFNSRPVKLRQYPKNPGLKIKKNRFLLTMVKYGILRLNQGF